MLAAVCRRPRLGFLGLLPLALTLAACGGRAAGPWENWDGRSPEPATQQPGPEPMPPREVVPSAPVNGRPSVPIELPGMPPIAGVVPTAVPMPMPMQCLMGGVGELCATYAMCELSELDRSPIAQQFIAQYNQRVGCTVALQDAGPCGADSVYDLTCTCVDVTGRQFTRLDASGGYGGITLYYALDRGLAPLVAVHVSSDTYDFCNGSSFSGWYGEVLDCNCGERR